MTELAAPIMSTSLIMPGESMAECDPEQIRDLLEHQVDLIIHGGYLGEHPTTVVDFSNDDIEVVREGEGDPSPFQ